MRVIPVNSNGSRRILVDLGDGIGVIQFRTYWNPTMQTWNLDLRDDAGNDLILGLPLVVGINILDAHTEIKSRIGQLRVVSLNPAINNRSEEALGTTAFLVHFPPGEFEGSFPAPDFLPFQVVDIDDATAPSIC